MNKLRIAIDMDEVLADPIDKFITLYQRDHGFNYTLEQMHGKEFYQLLPEELVSSYRAYLNEKGFFRDLKVIPGAVEVVERLCQKYDVYIVSAATEFPLSLEDKQAWLADHFPFISWTNIIFCGHKIVDVDIIIDDRIKNFQPHIKRHLLFTSPHNVGLTEYERVNTWEEVAALLL